MKGVTEFKGEISGYWYFYPSDFVGNDDGIYAKVSLTRDGEEAMCVLYEKQYGESAKCFVIRRCKSLDAAKRLARQWVRG